MPNVLLNYGYDAAGNLLSVTDRINGVLKGTNAYSYDILNRVTKLTQSGAGVTGKRVDMSYDAVNRLTGLNQYGDLAGTLSVANSTYTYDTVGRLTNLTHQHGGNTIASYGFSYDAVNRTKRTEIVTGKITEYNWDYRNRLSSVVFKDAVGNVVKSIAYTYDVSDRRISKKIDGVVAERYVYDGENIALVFDGAGVQTHRYLYGTGVDQILADERGGSVVWALADNLGTVRDVVDGLGVVLNHVTFDSYGRVIAQTNPAVDFRYGYTGREQDNETGLDYYRARYYDSAVGRFISEDPIGFSAGDANLTRYVGNSPTNWIDPSGTRGALSELMKKVLPEIFSPKRKRVKSTGKGFGTNKLRRGSNSDPFKIKIAPVPANSEPRPVPMVLPEVVDPNCPEEVRKKEEEERRKKCPNGFVYRGDTRSPAQIRKAGGFWPRNPNGNISLREHVTQQRDNPKVDYSDIFVDIDKESQWVSTSKIEQYAALYSAIKSRITKQPTGEYGYLYKICQPPNGRDVSLEVGLEGTPPGKEISFPGVINSTYIESYRKVKGPDDKIIPKRGEAPIYILGKPTRFNR